jgi:hypothetical protein
VNSGASAIELTFVSDKPSEERSDQEPSVPDDVWEQFARDSERDIRGSAPKEPSARARMVSERLRRQDEQGIRPDGWRTGPATDGRKSRRRRWWAILGVPLAIVLAVVAMRPSLLPGDPFGADHSGAGAGGSALPAETERPTGAPSTAAPDTPTIDRPFAGSPAARWADGAAGIVPPEAKAVGTRTKAQVAQALQQTKALLVDANIDPDTLLGGNPETALSVLDPKQPKMLDDARSSLSKPDQEHDPLRLFSRFDPDEVRLVGDVVKTRGRMTFKAGGQASVAIHADYTFVYPVSRGDSPEVTRTIVRRVLDLELPDPAKYRVTPGKLSVARYDQDLGNSACGVYDGFLHPHFDSQGPTGAPANGPTTDPYDRSRDIGHSGNESCGVVSRT